MLVRGERFFLVLLVLVAAATYLHGLGQVSIPSIGDEGTYLRIAQDTGAAGSLLPLRYHEGIWNTKPPLLFWQALLTASGQPDASLFAYRWPSVVFTFLMGIMIAWFLFQVLGQWAVGVRAALVFLSFLAIYQHGRPYLMHAAEVFFLTVPTLVLVVRRKWDFKMVLGAGLSLGVAALYKSFALVIVGGAALAVVTFFVLDDRTFWRQMPRVVGAVVIGFVCFSLWPLLDPQPELVWQQFIVGENAGKFTGRSYLTGLFSGPYPLTRIWLGTFANVGLWGLLLAGLLLTCRRERRTVRPDWLRALTAYVLVFLFFYSLPSQRQENYILPTLPVVAIFFSFYWDRIGSVWWRLSGVLVFLILIVAGGLVRAVVSTYGLGFFSPVLYGALFVAGLAAFLVLARPEKNRLHFLLAGLVILYSVQLFLQPFSAPFSSAAARVVTGQEVHVPSNFRDGEMKFRWLLPSKSLRPYALKAGVPPYLPQGTWVVAPVEQLNIAEGGTYRIFETKPHLQSRLTADQIFELVVLGKTQHLVGQIALAQKESSGE